MSKEKQIEEMNEEEFFQLRVDILEAYHCARGTDDYIISGQSISDMAELLGNRFGYRKQSEGEWIWDKEHSNYKCSLCGEYDTTTPNFCRGCGAKMKGGAE